MSQRLTVTLQPAGRRVEVEAGTNLLEAAQKAGIEMVASCGGIGICATCRVRVVDGKVTPPGATEVEELGREQLEAGFRLACQTVPLGDVRLEIPRESLLGGQQMQVTGRESQVEIDPTVRGVDIRLEPPALDDLRSDTARVNEALIRQGFAPLQAGPGLLEALSLCLRAEGWQARLALRPNGAFSELAAVLPVGAPLLGLAVDMGSTKLALFLVELESGSVLGQAGVMNPQIVFGDDVVSRIAYANKSVENRKLLQTRLVEAINLGAAELCKKEDACLDQIVEIVAVGNTAMHHLFCGLPVEQLGSAPYVPVTDAALVFSAAEVGLAAAAGANVYLPPNIAGYVGADHVAALLATQSYVDGHTTMVVDIGTNTEISLIRQGRVLSCSCASGPAFEGAHIRDGMRAGPGAIERLRIDSEGVRPVTIDGQPAVGICGSGILNAVAEMLGERLLDERGVLNVKDERVRSTNGKAEFLLAPASSTGHGRDIVITRKDVNEIQLAKGAIRAGLDILLAEANISPNDVDDFIIAGAFGTYLDLPSALKVGMFPRLPLERYHQVGNAAGVGARHLLLSRRKREEARQIAAKVEYIELTTSAAFTPRFVEAMYLKE
ncbi:MAG: DUF4445 domain-containing protein [Anaerolineaceae bacterium]|nr:DUF4445 domain-containing protein [Anaerolineaceae bacterium]